MSDRGCTVRGPKSHIDPLGGPNFHIDPLGGPGFHIKILVC